MYKSTILHITVNHASKVLTEPSLAKPFIMWIINSSPLFILNNVMDLKMVLVRHLPRHSWPSTCLISLENTCFLQEQQHYATARQTNHKLISYTLTALYSPSPSSFLNAVTQTEPAVSGDLPLKYPCGLSCSWPLNRSIMAGQSLPTITTVIHEIALQCKKCKKKLILLIDQTSDGLLELARFHQQVLDNVRVRLPSRCTRSPLSSFKFVLFLFLMCSQQEHIKKESICQPVEWRGGRGWSGERVCACVYVGVWCISCFPLHIRCPRFLQS